MINNDSFKILKPTAMAIFEIASELNIAEEMYEELKECAKLFEDEDIKKFFFNLEIPKKDKMDIINNRLKPILSKETSGFISILTEHDAINMLPDIIIIYKEFLDEYKDLIRVKVVSASKIDSKTLDNILDTVKCFTKKEVYLETTIDESLIGGIIVSIGSVVYDYSIKNQIHRMQNKFINGGNSVQ